MADLLPTLSVVTVVYNDEAHLADTIASVLEQDYAQIEYLVVDGGSTDGTLDIIEAYRNNIDQFVSEPDRGIYDAMNKGARMATGQWIYFMNSGDRFASPCVVSEVFAAAHSEAADILYGSSIRLTHAGPVTQRPKPRTKLWKSVLTSHQAMFVRTQWLVDYPFDLQYRVCSDYDFFYKIVEQGARLQEVDVTFAVVEARDGFSVVREVERQRENRRISASYHWHYYHQFHLLMLEWRARWRRWRAAE